MGGNFKLLDNTATEITVPFLVTKEELNCPIIGYNVIERFVKDNGPEQVLPAVTNSFNNTDASALVNFITSDTTESLCTVRSQNVQKESCYPKRSVSEHFMSCQHWTDTTYQPSIVWTWRTSHLAFHETLTMIKRRKSSIIDIPVSNTTRHDIVLPSRLVLGRLHLVRSVTPLEVKLKDEDVGEEMGASEMGSEPDEQTTTRPSPTGNINSRK